MKIQQKSERKEAKKKLNGNRLRDILKNDAEDKNNNETIN